MYAAVERLLMACKDNDKGKQVVTRDSPIYRWKPPREGFYKLNTDGAWINSAIAAGGGVIRKHGGSWAIGFSCKFDGAISPLAAELYVVYEALIIAENQKMTRIEIETDAISLKKMLNTAGANPHHEVAAIIMDVYDILKKFEIAIVSHIPREYNELAHMLAKYGKEMAVGYTPHYFVPDCVRDIYEMEKDGATAAGPS